MPIVGVSRTAVVMCSQTGCRVTLNRRTKPESKCGGRTTQIQVGQEPTHFVSLRQTVPAYYKQKGFTVKEPEKFKLLIEACRMVLPYMPSIQGRKAHQKNAAEHWVPQCYSKSFLPVVKRDFLVTRFAAYLSILHDAGHE